MQVDHRTHTHFGYTLALCCGGLAASALLLGPLYVGRRLARIRAARLARPPRALQVTTYNTLARTYTGINGGAWYAHIDPALMQWDNRQLALIGRIRSFKSDIICLQEVEADFFKTLQENLTGYTGVLLNQSGKPGEALFVRRPFEIIETSKVVAADGRFAQLSILRWRDSDLTIGVLNGHLAWDPAGAQAYAEIQDFVQRGIQNHPASHWVICGDFNVTRESEAVKYLEQLGYHRAYRGVEPVVTCSVSSAAHEVDFIFGSEKLRTAWVKPVTPISGKGMLPCPGEPSDHLPKTAIFSLPRARQIR
jgi:mRNA deadenylase 3'-5' endonuclease subunit Ccr4